MFERLYYIIFPYIATTRDLNEVLQSLVEFIDHERTDATSKMRESYAAMQSDHDRCKHEILVSICTQNLPILNHLNDGKKISAIKVLRGIVGHSNASLVATKRAVEDDRVSLAANNLKFGSATTEVDPELADHNSNYQQGMTQECSE